MRMHLKRGLIPFFPFFPTDFRSWRESLSEFLGKKEKSPLSPVFPTFSLGKKGGKKAGKKLIALQSKLLPFLRSVPCSR